MFHNLKAFAERKQSSVGWVRCAYLRNSGVMGPMIALFLIRPTGPMKKDAPRKQVIMNVLLIMVVMVVILIMVMLLVMIIFNHDHNINHILCYYWSYIILLLILYYIIIDHINYGLITNYDHIINYDHNIVEDNSHDIFDYITMI